MMSTREIAYSIFEQLGEEELQGFIALFRKAYMPKSPTQKADNNDIEKRKAIFARMENMCKYIPDIDEKKELAEYREE